MAIIHPDPPTREGVSEVGKGRRLGWAEFGDPNGDTILWFHGTPGARRQVPPGIGDAARRHGFRVLGVERPGTGASTNHHLLTVGDFATDVAGLADALGVDRFGVVGLSGGGPYTLATAARLPERVAVAGVLGGLGPTIGTGADTPTYTQLLVPFVPLISALRYTVGGLASRGLSALERVGESAYDLYVRLNGRADAEFMATEPVKGMFLSDLLGAAALRAPFHDLALFGRPWGVSLDRIEVPVLFWHGDADHIVPISQGERQAETVPDSEFAVIPGMGHFGGFSDPEGVLAGMRRRWTGASVTDRGRTAAGRPA